MLEIMQNKSSYANYTSKCQLYTQKMHNCKGSSYDYFPALIKWIIIDKAA